MITTNKDYYKKDLEEVIAMFCDLNLVEITHFAKYENGVFYNTFSAFNETFSYENTKEFFCDLEFKRYEKRFSKLGLYDLLSKHFNKTFEWGALTGIRPVKMAYSFGENFEKEFKNVFGVSDKKIDLTKKIIQNQKGIIDLKGEYSDLFIGIPFCPSRCEYCSFISQEIKKSTYAHEYSLALKKEIENSIPLLKNLRSIYIGGGTPVCLEIEDLKIILNALKPILKSGLEFTVEAGRPDAITEEKLKLLKEYSVTRICVNPQTFKNETLKLIGRNHTAEQILSVYELAKKYGFIINADIIAGLPEESFSDFKATVDKIIELNPDNFTVHTLCVKRGSKLKERVSRLPEGEIYKMIDYAEKTAKENGYEPYYLYRQKYAVENLENVGYSKKGKECVYNIDVMEETSNNVACGANAVSKRVFLEENRIERYGSPKDVPTYVQKVDEIINEKNKLYE